MSVSGSRFLARPLAAAALATMCGCSSLELVFKPSDRVRHASFTHTQALFAADLDATARQTYVVFSSDWKLAVSMQSKGPLTLILSPLRAGRGEHERTGFGSLFGEPATVPPKVPLFLCERERVKVRVRLDCMDTA